MDLRLSAEEENFRRKVVTFIDESFPLEARESPSPAEVEHWHQAVVNKGWSAPEWPVLAGGPGWSIGEIFLWYVTTAQFNCPHPDDYALQVVAPLLLAFGNVDQQSHLPQILNRTATWGNAVFFDGSADINAEDRGDCYQINGQVVCIAESGHDHLLLLADTGGGHSLFVIDSTLDGISFESEEPANSIQTVIFDKAAVPDSCLLGEVNLASKYLEYIYVEKQSLSQIVQLEAGLNYLKEVVQTFGLQSEMENPVAAIEIELTALKITGLRHNLRHKPPTHSQQSSGSKETQVVIVKGLNLAQQIGDSLIDALGYYAIPADQVLPGSNEPKPVFSAAHWKSNVIDIMPGCPQGFRQDLIAKTLLGL
jgi:alkylation response protein AidB-like acyl-CoA dehydrogenase